MCVCVRVCVYREEEGDSRTAEEIEEEQRSKAAKSRAEVRRSPIYIERDINIDR